MSDMPWDDAYLLHNLQVLARLKPGNALSVLKDGAVPRDARFRNLGKRGRGLRPDFRIRTSGIMGIKKKFNRFRKGEDLLDDYQYQIPLVMLFSYAKEALDNHRLRITKNHMLKAHEGLFNLQKTYASASMPYQNKMREIIFVTSCSLPDFIKIEIKGRGTMDLFRDYPYLHFKEDIFAHLDFTNNKNASTEVRASSKTCMYVFGRKHSETSTRIPTEKSNNRPKLYRRKGAGICVQAYKDFPRSAEKLKVNGAIVRFPSVESRKDDFLNEKDKDILKVYYDAAGRDDAILYVLSQLLNQAGMEYILTAMFSRRISASRGDVEFNTFVVNGFFFAPTSPLGNLQIDTLHGKVRCTANLYIPTKNAEVKETPLVCAFKVGDVNVSGMVFPQFIGIKKFAMSLVIDLIREGSYIKIIPVLFKIDHHIVRRKISDEKFLEACNNISDAEWQRRWGQ